jgi:hypothetical protein
MSAACYCDDGETADMYIVTKVRAAKQHKCYECHHHIQRGELHEAVRSLYEGRFSTTRTCARCLDVREYVTAHAPCFCWMHGSLLDDARDTLREYAYASAGFWIGGMKRVLRAENAKGEQQ